MANKNFKLIFLIVATVLLSKVSVYAESYDIELETEIIDPNHDDPPNHRGAVFVPQLGIDNHTLLLYTSCDGCTLQLVNEENEIEYSIIIPANTNTIELPSYLSGEYRIEIIRGRFVFCGTIFL